MKDLILLGAGAFLAWQIMRNKDDSILDKLGTDIGSGNAGEMATGLEAGRTLYERYAAYAVMPPSSAPYWYEQTGQKRLKPMGIMGTVYNAGGQPLQILRADQAAVRTSDLNKVV